MAPESPITDVLRRAILNGGVSLLRIANDTGVQRASLSRFVRGKNSLRLDVADKLAAYFGLELSKVEKKTDKKHKE
jgi:plasmid maintenance system antidote protein VapI